MSSMLFQFKLLENLENIPKFSTALIKNHLMPRLINSFSSIKFMTLFLFSLLPKNGFLLFLNFIYIKQFQILFTYKFLFNSSFNFLKPIQLHLRCDGTLFY